MEICVENAIYYMFSTIAQVLAAVIAVGAAFVVFRRQAILAACETLKEYARVAVKRADLPKFEMACMHRNMEELGAIIGLDAAATLCGRLDSGDEIRDQLTARFENAFNWCAPTIVLSLVPLAIAGLIGIAPQRVQWVVGSALLVAGVLATWKCLAQVRTVVFWKPVRKSPAQRDSPQTTASGESS